MTITELDQLKGYEVGAIEYISVPVVPEILRTKVTVLVELHQRRRHLEALNSSLTQARNDLEMRHASALAERDAQLHAIFEHPTETFVVLQAVRDPGGTIVDFRYRDANTNALELLGPKPRSIARLPPDGDVRSASRRAGSSPERSGAADPATSLVTKHTYPRQGFHSSRCSRWGRTAWSAPAPTSPSASEPKRHSGTAKHATVRAKLALREANARKDEFLAMLSHELRNPAAAIGNAAQALVSPGESRQRNSR